MKNHFKIFTNLKALAVIAVAIAVIVVAVSVNRVVKSSTVSIESNKAIDITPEQIQAIRSIGEWEFLSVSTEEMVDTMRHGIVKDDHLVRIYYGTLRLGINLHSAKPGWIKATGDTVVVNLPPITLLDQDFIDEAQSKSFHESGSWTAADREALYQRAYQKMKDKCLTASNIRSAENNADAQFRNMMRSIGFNNVVVRFDTMQSKH